jgi:hypothetical protein
MCINMSRTHHRWAGYLFGMLLDFAADNAGYPIFCLAMLPIHRRKMLMSKCIIPQPY